MNNRVRLAYFIFPLIVIVLIPVFYAVNETAFRITVALVVLIFLTTLGLEAIEFARSSGYDWHPTRPTRGSLAWANLKLLVVGVTATMLAGHVYPLVYVAMLAVILLGFILINGMMFFWFRVDPKSTADADEG